MNTLPRILAVGEEPPPLRAKPGRERGPISVATSPKGKTKTTGGKGAGRFRTLNTFVDCTMADLNRAELAVWLVLYRDTRDGTARTAQTDIARRAGCDRRTVNRALRGLERLGLVKVIHRGGLGRGLSRYHVRALVANG